VFALWACVLLLALAMFLFSIAAQSNTARIEALEAHHAGEE
jgi:hypothetical protein